LADFGCSRFLYGPAYTKKVITFHYRPPELWFTASIPYGTEIDVWSMAIVAIEIVIGSHFSTQNSEHLFLKELASVVDLSMYHQYLVGQDLELKDVKTIGVLDRLKDGREDAVIDERLVNLLERMLDPNPKMRITAKDALDHPFLREDSDNVTGIPKKMGDVEFLEYNTINWNTKHDIKSSYRKILVEWMARICYFARDSVNTFSQTIDLFDVYMTRIPRLEEIPRDKLTNMMHLNMSCCYLLANWINEPQNANEECINYRAGSLWKTSEIRVAMANLFQTIGCKIPRTRNIVCNNLCRDSKYYAVMDENFDIHNKDGSIKIETDENRINSLRMLKCICSQYVDQFPNVSLEC